MNILNYGCQRMSNIMDEDNQAYSPVRGQFTINIGVYVRQGNVVYKIEQILDFNTVIGTNVESGRSQPLRIADLRPISQGADVMPYSPDLAEIVDEDWQEAERRYAAIKPVIDQAFIGRKEIEVRAKAINVDVATLYRWIKTYKSTGSVVSLIPQKRGWKLGAIRIPEKMEQIIQTVIDEYYLTIQRPTVQKTVSEVKRKCEQQGIDPPSSSTIRNRITKIDEKKRLWARGYKELAKNKFLAVPGTFPNADFPLAVVQIDHTPVDIILVDDVYRKPIGRPWITFSIDVFSRVITGYYLSFDPPSGTSVGMCVSHSILPKEEWLLLHKVDAAWPVWGIPKKIHVDNGSDFRADAFRKSCLAYSIHLEFRPVKQPRYGGHIERLVGSFLKEIHSLPGTTFSSIKDRDGYDSEKNAAFTKSEFEEYIVTWICQIYHKRLHTGIGMSPMKKWEIGVFGNAKEPGVGLPAIPSDKQNLYLDFLPSFERTIQTFGVTIDGMHYYSESLRPWINSDDPLTPGKKRNFTFRRDSRDISSLWFFDPDVKSYFKIPFANLSLPAISIWEYQSARSVLKKEGMESVDEQQLLRTITELRNKVDSSVARTKKARRMAQRRKEHEKSINPAQPIPEVESQSSKKSFTSSGLSNGEITDFGEFA